MTNRTIKEPVVMITLRVPPWLHDAIQEASHDKRTSINQYCIRVLTRSVGKEPVDAAISNPFGPPQAKRA